MFFSWYIYLHLVDFCGKLVAKYTSHMDPTGIEMTDVLVDCVRPLSLAWFTTVDG